MKRIKLPYFFVAAFALTVPLAGCMHGDSGSAANDKTEQQIETLTDENEVCPDGDCKNSECPDGNCPVSPLPEHRGHAHGRGHGRVKPLPCPRG
ncbi:MAG: hypothetical protein NC131_07950 [Roseburia sp.]|nr:hypothetical protein [Roseburia sp.]